jgi:photosystem II stability/assembly factor-like uncharacterized protein
MRAHVGNSRAAPRRRGRPSAKLRATLAAAVAASVMVSCSSDERSSSGADGASPEGALRAGHVHGIEPDPGSGDLYVATHQGLFVYGESGPPRRVGPVIDLMGFGVLGPGQLYASGHPSAGTGLPQPVGLIESADGGDSWRIRSRGGQSDFHALTVSDQGVLGFDGTLRHSADWENWRELSGPKEIVDLAAAPRGSTVLATTASGLQISTRHGESWTPVPGAPPLVLVDWTDGQRVVGVDVKGAVFTSQDASRTWRRAAGDPLGEPQAVGAGIINGRLEIFVVNHEAILRSTDYGASFSPNL